MLKRDDLLGEIESAARELVQAHDQSSVAIATLSVNMRTLLQRTVVNGDGIQDVSALFDLCRAIDVDPSCRAETAIEQDVLRLRAQTLLKMIKLLYDRKVAGAIEKQAPLRDEMRMALQLAPELPVLCGVMQKQIGPIGPDWLERHCSADLWQEIEAFVYDWDSNSDQWGKFVALLPTDLRERFDVTLVPIELPSEITNPEQARALLELIVHRRGLHLRLFLTPAYLVQWRREDPASYKLLMSYAHILMQQDK